MNRTNHAFAFPAAACGSGLVALTLSIATGITAQVQLLGWNNLGMHCMDSDYSVFSILPPYNTIEAQLIVAGRLVTNSVGYTVTYQAVADPQASYNSTSAGKGSFYEYCQALYGATLAADQGLLSWPMPGTNNTPRNLLFETTNQPAPGAAVQVNWFRAEGIPITPYDDAGAKNPYPLMRLIARNNTGAAIATNDIVLPVSDEMDCRTCHGSGTDPAAQPAAGWTWSLSPERDYRLNILRLHDQSQFRGHQEVYQSALRERGFSPLGLYFGAAALGEPVLCAVCHASEALGTGSYSNVPPLTASVHSVHGGVIDPDLNMILDNTAHRSACYRCHPGSTTRCLRGAMGGAVAADGAMALQCQSCHGNLSLVGSPSRVGWFMEPNCQSCHTGTAVNNNGEIRYTSTFLPNGQTRVAVDSTFAASPNTPAAGLSLYRFSAGHGKLQCSACHGSTHAEFPSTHANDNLRNQALQGHVGMMVECTACHVAMTVSAASAAAGPHGLHPIGQSWVNGHGDLVEGNAQLRAGCAKCHGSDGKGTVLSRAQNDRSFSSSYGARTYWRKQTVSCYDCHNGPNSENATSHPQLVAAALVTNTPNNTPLLIPLRTQGAGTAAFRIVSQALHGTVGLSNNIATYFPEPGYLGADRFSFSASDGFRDSTLGSCDVSVTASGAQLTVSAIVPPTAAATWPSRFAARASAFNTGSGIVYEWNFGDATPAGVGPVANHAYTQPGTYQWSVTARSGSSSSVANGTIQVLASLILRVTAGRDQVTLSWDAGSFDAVLEVSDLRSPVSWTPVLTPAAYGPQVVTVSVPAAGAPQFYRLRKVL